MKNIRPRILPLDGLFHRLEIAGFEISPADRLRAWRILSGPAKYYLQEPEQLKLLLAPVLARNATEQDKFYDLFDQFYAELSLPLPPPPASGFELPRWVLWLFLAVLGSWLIYSFYRVSQSGSENEIAVAIVGPSVASVGDTVTFHNRSEFEIDTNEIKWSWQYQDTRTGEIEISTEEQFHLQLVIPPVADSAYAKEVQLLVHDQELDTVYVARHALLILCPSAPEITDIISPQQVDAGESIDFRVAAEKRVLRIENYQGRPQVVGPAADWEFYWDFGDGETGRRYTARHTYSKKGQYEVKLVVVDPTAQGRCETIIKRTIKVGLEEALLPLHPINKDRATVVATWSWGLWVLLALLGFSVIYFWVRWLARRNEELPDENSPEQQVAARFKVHDKAPYYIPFNDQNQNIAGSPEVIRLADALRLRQRGLRQVVDVLSTVKETIDQGGFPVLRYRHLSQPSEYLFLVDEVHSNSHQSRLFHYVVDFLGNQDVNLEVFYYQRHLNHFWNNQHPEGLSLERVQRLYPVHRLMVLGDLHELIDPHAAGSPRMRPDLGVLFRRWRQAYLLSPIPPESWSYREKIMARHFSIFPCDTEGLAATALALENDAEPLANGYAFDRWQERQAGLRNDSDTEHRRWRRWRAIDDYFQPYDPVLRDWFLALAVFPTPSWEITLAIGQALEIPLQFDHLLVLARIPALQMERFDERLRQEMLEVLDPEIERIARQAVQEQLDRVKAITTESHATHQLETALAVQAFALDPYLPENRDAIRYLLNQGMLNKGQEKELDRVSHKETASPEVSKAAKKKKLPVSAGLSTQAWLDEDIPTKEEEAEADRPIWTPDLWKALGATLAYVLLLTVAWWSDNSPELYNLAFGGDSETEQLRSDGELRDYFFLKEVAIIDSAIIYNNLGVDEWLVSSDTGAAYRFKQALQAAEPFIPGKSTSFNGETVPYQLANQNLAAVYFNAAVDRYNYTLETGGDSLQLLAVFDLLAKANLSERLVPDIQHARGLTHFYSGAPLDTMMAIYYELEELGYFDTLSYSPNLTTLLGLERSHIMSMNVNDVGDRVLEISIDYFTTLLPFPSYRLRVFPTENEGAVPDTVVVDLPLGPGSEVVRFEPPRPSSPGKSGVFRAELIGPTGLVADVESLNYPHVWFVNRASDIRQETSPATPPDKEEPNLVNNYKFSFQGTVIDAASNMPLEGANIQFIDESTEYTRGLIQFTATTDAKGDFYLNGIFENNALSDVFILRIGKSGYQTDQRSITVREAIDFSNTSGAAGQFRLSQEPTKGGPDIGQIPPQQEDIPEQQQGPPSPGLNIVAPSSITLYFGVAQPRGNRTEETTSKSYSELLNSLLSEINTYRKRAQDRANVFELPQILIQFDRLRTQAVTGSTQLSAASSQVAKALENGYQVRINLSPYLTSREKSTFTNSIGSRRADAIINYFEYYEDGRLQPYIDSGQLTFRQGSPVVRSTGGDDYSYQAADQRKVIVGFNFSRPVSTGGGFR